MDDLSPGMNGFEGFTRMDGQFGIVTSQVWYAGRNATWKEISAYFLSMEFLPVRSDVYEVPVRWYHVEQNVALFDVGESNVILSNGEMMAIDIVPVRPGGVLRQRLREALGLGADA